MLLHPWLEEEFATGDLGMAGKAAGAEAVGAVAKKLLVAARRDEALTFVTLLSPVAVFGVTSLASSASVADLCDGRDWAID